MKNIVARMATALALACLVAVSAAPTVLAEDAPKGHGKAKKKNDAEKLKVGDAAPSFALKTLNPELCGGTNMSSKTFFGSTATKKIGAMIVSFASANCKPCKKELPELHKLYLRLKPRGLEVLVIAMDKEVEDIAFMTKMAQDNKFTFPVLTDRFTILARRYHADELPYVVLVDGAGVIRWTKVGYTPTTLDELEKALEPMLRESVGGEAPAPAGPEETGK